MYCAAMKKLLLLVGVVVCLCAPGCEEGDKSVKVENGDDAPVFGVLGSNSRPTNKQPGAPVLLPSVRPAADANYVASSVPFPKPVEAPAREINSEPLTNPQGRKLHSSALAQALVESRKISSRLQDDILRNSINQEKQKREIRELKERLAQLDIPNENPKPFVQTVQAPQPPQSAEKIKKLQKLNFKLSRTVTRQAEEIKAQEQKQSILAGQVAELQKQTEDIRRKTKQRVAVLERRIVEKNDLITIAKQIEQSKAQQQEQALRKQTLDLKSQIASLHKETEQRVTLLEKRIAEKNSLIATMRQSFTPAPAEPAPTVEDQPFKSDPPPSPDIAKAKPISPVAPKEFKPIAGKISAVDELMILVDIGEEAGLEEGMRLIAYRNDRFIGYLRVEEVSTREAACSFTRKIIEPKAGDSVIDRLE